MKSKILGVVAAACLLIAAPANAATLTNVSIDINAGVVSFALTYDSAPDFFTVDSFGRQAESFQFYIGGSGSGPPQFLAPLASVIRGEEIHTFGAIPVRSSNAPPEPPPGTGWGGIRAMLPYSLNNNVLTFVATLADLNEPDGYYPQITWEAYHFGATYAGHGSPLPLPGALALFATGLGALGLLGWGRAAEDRTSRVGPRLAHDVVV
jgi:hypothetical protein